MDKLKVYLDNCCYNRPFDDLTVGKNALEAMAKMFIQALIKYNSVSLCYSFMTLYEINDSPLEENKRHIQNFIVTNVAVYISKARYDEIEKLTNGIMLTGIKQKDDTHLACSIFAGCDYFITVDKGVLKYKSDKIETVNLIEFVGIWRSL